MWVWGDDGTGLRLNGGRRGEEVWLHWFRRRLVYNRLSVVRLQTLPTGNARSLYYYIYIIIYLRTSLYDNVITAVHRRVLLLLLLMMQFL